MHEVLNIDKNKNKLHSLVGIDETNLLSLVSPCGQYLSNTNEKATVSILQNILELNKITRKFYKIFHISRHIESLDVCMKY